MWNKLTLFSINNSRWISRWIIQFCNSADLAKCGFYKRSGAAVYDLIRMLLALPLTDIPLYGFAKQQLPGPGRDAFYRLLQHPGYNWRRLLYTVSQKLITYITTLTDERHRRVLIIDDSAYKRDRSTKVEYLGRQHDHNEGRYYRGFRMLTLAWSDGHSCLPCDFELLTNHQPNKRMGPDPTLDRRTVMGRRVKAATQKATDVTVDMIKRAQEAGNTADYVVFDSWFALPSVIRKAAGHVPVVCRMKDINAVQFHHDNRIFTIKNLYEYLKRKGQIKAHGDHDDIEAWLNVELLNVGIVRVVFVKPKGKTDQPIVLLSTDSSLKAEDMCQIYGQRWDIEVCFKALKQHLGLYSQQVRQYAALVSCTSLAFLRCMMISYYHRSQIDERTLPGVFHECIMQLKVASVQTCIKLLQTKIISTIIQDPNRPILALVADIGETVDQFVTMISANMSFESPFLTNCES